VARSRNRRGGVRKSLRSHHESKRPLRASSVTPQASSVVTGSGLAWRPQATREERPGRDPALPGFQGDWVPPGWGWGEYNGDVCICSPGEIFFPGNRFITALPFWYRWYPRAPEDQSSKLQRTTRARAQCVTASIRSELGARGRASGHRAAGAAAAVTSGPIGQRGPTRLTRLHSSRAVTGITEPRVPPLQQGGNINPGSEVHRRPRYIGPPAVTYICVPTPAIPYLPSPAIPSSAGGLLI
jgi:hypothetical protein